MSLKIWLALFFFWCNGTTLLWALENPRMQTLLVRETDTLWKISHRFLKDPARWPELAKYNPWLFSEQFVLFPGTELKIPAHLIADYFHTAKLVEIFKEVFYKSSSHPNWLQAYKNMVLFEQDHLKTTKESQAQVQFKNKDLLLLQEDSVVMLSLEPGKEQVNLFKGSALMQASSVKLLTPTAFITPKKERTLYRTKVHPDEATTVQVEKGLTEVQSRATGKSLMVTEGFANITRQNQDPGSPIAVPPMEEFNLSQQLSGRIKLAKANESPPTKTETAKPEEQTGKGYEIANRPLPELAKLDKREFARGDDTLHKNPKWKRYRLQIASNANFKPLEREYERAVVKGKPVMEMEEDYQLPNGTYFRRVAYIDENGKESEFYNLPALELLTRNPALSLELPEDELKTREQLVSVKGKSLPGLIVTVNGLAVEVRTDGSFFWAVLLAKKGANKIRVEAKDLQGNRSYLERTVYSLR